MLSEASNQTPVETPKALTARQLLQQVYDRFTQLPEVRRIHLPRLVFCEIARDGLGPGSPKTGNMLYRDAIVFALQKASWAMAFGMASNDYLSRRYDCDIIAFPIPLAERSDEDLGQEIRNFISRKARYFLHSLLYAMADGRLAVLREASFARGVSRALAQASIYVAQGVETEPDLVEVAILEPLVTAQMLYKPDFAPFLFKRLLEALHAGPQSFVLW
jgi:hypothetical protein